MAENEIDYAIIGGGIAGTYCAWRLQEALGKNKKIVLFEYSNRIGGRLLTIHLPTTNLKGEVTKLKAELGGMRFIPMQKVGGTDEPYGHELFCELVNRFSLDVEDFPMGYKKKDEDNLKIDDKNTDEWGDENYAYFRDKHFKMKDLRDETRSLPFDVDWSERGKSPNMLQEHVQNILVPGADKLDLHKWFEIMVFGDYLWKYGFWNLLYRVLSPEAYLLLKYGSGYDTNASNGNAVALLPILKDYLSSTQYKTLKDGMMSLPERLKKEFQSPKGMMDPEQRVQLNHRLESIGKRDDNGFYELSFAKTRQDNNKKELTIDTGDYDNDWKAKNIVLAMPTIALQKIKWKPFQNDKNVIKLIDSVLPQEAIKLALGYPYAWWKELKLFRGRSISDLPIRQTLYFSNLKDRDEKDPFKIKPDEPSLLVASYSDIESVPFWRGLEGTEDDKPYSDSPEGYCASKIMVDEAHRQVMRIHGQYELPQPTSAAYRDWGDLPFGAAWHSWKPGERYDETIDRIRKPVEGEQVFICGEAYSAQQGWAEGALNTAEQLLTDNLKLPPLIPVPAAARALGVGPTPNLRVDAKGRRY